MSQNVDETEEYELEEKLATTTSAATTTASSTTIPTTIISNTTTNNNIMDSPSSELANTCGLVGVESSSGGGGGGGVGSLLPLPTLSLPVEDDDDDETNSEKPNTPLPHLIPGGGGGRERLQSTETTAVRTNSTSSWFNFNKLTLGGRKRSFNVANDSSHAPIALLDDLSRVSSALALNKDNSGRYIEK